MASMEERLKLTISKENTKSVNDLRKRSKSSATSGESVAVLLIQGLHSADKHILDQILDKNEDTVICSTINQLPVQSLPQLLMELNSRLRTRTDVRPYVKWLRYALVHNASYLSSNPEVVEQLCSYYREFESRVRFMDSMLKLQGKVNFLIDQYDRVNKVGSFKGDNQQALTVYEDASSSETESETEREKSEESENEEGWDDLDWEEDNKEDETEDIDEDLLRFSAKKKKNVEDDDSVSQASNEDQNDEEDGTGDDDEENSVEMR